MTRKKKKTLDAGNGKPVKAAKKILIFIAAYNAESTIEKVLKRIPTAIYDYNYEILIIDDKSADHTFDRAAAYKARNQELQLTVLSNPEKLGYGGSQKLGFHYAIENDFAAVVLLHGDGQFTPEELEKLILPVLNEEADAVFAGRIAKDLKPTGYRVYSINVLKQIPYALNTDGFHFNQEIAMQLKLNESRICEISIPARMEGKGWPVNGLLYSWNVLRSSLRARLHQLNVSYYRQFDIVKPGHSYPPKFDFLSSHTMAINEVRAGSQVLDIGSGAGYVGRELEKRGCQVTGVDMALEAESQLLQKYSKIDLNCDPLPYPADSFDFILLLDVLEHLDLTAQIHLLEEIRTGAKSKKPLLIITTPNIAFLFIRLGLLVGKFNYGKRGILDMPHKHLFTFKSVRRFLKQAGYKIEKVKGIPPPIPQIIGNNMISRFLLRVNAGLIRLIPGLFSYQIFVKATPLATADELLRLAAEKARERESGIKK
jgi:2-polyprenyl-3-methyl-5-hydroxy-6-metoxy-1,4-benzoquinol methylase